MAMGDEEDAKSGELTDAVVQKATDWQVHLEKGGLSGCVVQLQKAQLAKKSTSRTSKKARLQGGVGGGC